MGKHRGIRHKRALVLALWGLAVATGCQTSPQGLPEVAAAVASSDPAKFALALPASPGALGLGVGLNLAPAATLTVDPRSPRGPSNSHLLGWCRNHVSGLIPNLAAKEAAMKRLQPQWGDRRSLYRVGHGITDGRADYVGMAGYHFETAFESRMSYPYDDVRGAIEEAEAMGADQLHVVNFGTSDPEEAARYVSYLNHAGDPTRARYPSTAGPATLFELGNEIAWKRERGHDEYAPDDLTYATRAKAFARAMRAASDVPIQIGAVASINSNWLGDGWSGGAATVRHLLDTMGPDVDFLIFHGYPSWPLAVAGDLQVTMAQNEWNRRLLDSTIWPAIKASGRSVGIANTEFSTNLYNDAVHAQGLFGALYTADSLVLAMNEGLLASTQFCFSHGAVADSAYFYNDDPTRPTPIYGFERMLAEHWGDMAVGADVAGLPTKTVTGASAALELPTLGYTASASPDGSKVYLLVVARTNDRDVACKIDVGFTPSAVTAYTLSGAQGWGSTDASVTTQQDPGLTPYTFARATATILELTR